MICINNRPRRAGTCLLAATAVAALFSGAAHAAEPAPVAGPPAPADSAKPATKPAPAPAKKPEAKPDPWTLQSAIGSKRFKIDGTFRVRYESYDNGYRNNAPASDDALTLRTDIRAEYRGDGFRVGAEIRDARGYLDNTSTALGVIDLNALEPVQLYASVDLGKHASITGGRQLLNLGSKRLVADSNYPNSTNAFTGVRLDWTGPHKQALTAFFTMPQQHLPGDKAGLVSNKVVFDHEGTDLLFWGLWYGRAIGKLSGEAYVYGLDEDDRPDNATRNRHIVTTGLRLYQPRKPGHWDFDAEGAWQAGRIRTSTAATAPSVEVSAYMAHGEFGRTFKDGWTPRLSLFADIASGDHANSQSYNRFDSLFEPRRAEWGPSALFGPLGRSNLVDIGAKVEVKPGKRVDAFLEWRKVWLESATDSFSFTKVRDATGRSGHDGGSQGQARLRYWLVPKRVQLDVGAAVLTHASFIDRAPNATRLGDTHYGYADVTFFF